MGSVQWKGRGGEASGVRFLSQRAISGASRSALQSKFQDEAQNNEHANSEGLGPPPNPF